MVLNRMAMTYFLIILSVFMTSQAFSQVEKFKKFVDRFERRFTDHNKAGLKQQIYYAYGLDKLGKLKEAREVYHDVESKLSELSESNDRYQKYHYQILKQTTNADLNYFIIHKDQEAEERYKESFEKIEEHDLVNDDHLDMFESRYDKFKENIAARVRSWNYFVQGGLFFHKTDYDLVRQSNNETINLLGNYLSNHLGGGVRYENLRNAYSASLSYISGKGTVQSQGSATTFLQKGVTTSGFNIDFAFFLKRVEGKVDIGLNLGFLSLNHDVSEPSGFKVERSSVSSLTYGVESHYRFNNDIGLGLKFNDAPDLKSSTWQINFRYQF